MWTHDKFDEQPERDIQQVWFKGVHSDIGGSYTDAGLSDITLNWMLEGATKNGLIADPDKIADLKLNPSPTGKIHNSLSPWWWILGWKTREIPKESHIHVSVKERIELSHNSNEIPPYAPTLPDDAVFTK